MAVQYKEGARVRFLLHGEHDRTGEILARNQAKLQMAVVQEDGSVQEQVFREQEDWLIRIDGDGREVWINKDAMIEKVR